MVFANEGIWDGGEPYSREELEIINRARAQEIIRQLQHKRELWRLACEYDQIPSESSFVIFSRENPFALELNNGN